MVRDTQGMIGIKLVGRDEVRGLEIVHPDQAESADLLVVTENGFGKRTSIPEYPLKGRPTQGVYTLQVTERTGKLAAIRLTEDDETEIMLITQGGIVLRTDVGSISRYARQTQGVRVMRIEEGDRLAALAKLVASEDAPEAGGEQASTGVNLVVEAPVYAGVDDEDSAGGEGAAGADASED
jgi:DNA gyrase subunit A